MCILYLGYSFAPWPSMLVNSAMKSATTCPLMLVCKRYCMSNSLNSIVYSAIHPVALGLLIAHHRGLSFRTITIWAWKYGWCLWAIVTIVKASFSIGRYLSSAPWNARLVLYMGFCTLSSSLTKATLTAARDMAR